ncbi:SH3 domain-containing protein [Marinilabilia sp.]|uniref:SH3 domain-containing protein n=1 Tax=Marinilabilia sp. TaxID=2021252 RepID=UPI0025C33117|nr:SH3 domain-containing protein [Marinilabilia sp.]
MQKILFSLLFVILLLSCSCEGLVREDAVVSATKLNVREAASTTSQVLGQLKQGDTITIERPVFPGFAEITYQGNKAYVSQKYLTKVKDAKRELFLEKLQTADYFTFITMVLFLSFLCWGLTRLGHLALWNLTTFRTHYIKGFNFATIEENSGRKRITFLLTRVLGGGRQHPYLSFWVYVAFYYFLLPSFFLFPVLLMDISSQLTNKISIGGLNIEYSATVIWVVLGIGLPSVIFLVKCGMNIKREGSKKEWIAVFVALLFAVPTFIITLFLASITYFKYVILAFWVMLKIFAPTKRDWRYLNNSEHDDGITNI